MTSDWQKQWWAIPVAAALVGLGAVILADQFFQDLSDAAVFFLFALLGLSFLWLFWKRDIPWAVAPGVGLLTLDLAVLVNLFVEENNGWVAMLILALGAFVIAAIPNPTEGIKGIYSIGTMLLVIGFLMAPVTLLWKIVLCVASVLLGGYLLWRNWSKLGVAMTL